MDLFTFPIVKGSAESFRDRQHILIDETIASAYFGEEDPVGKIMSIFNDQGEEFTYTVGAVFEDLPLNTSFQFRVLTQFDNYVDMWEVDETRWQSWIAATFLHIPNTDQAATVEKLLENMVPAHNQAREDFQITAFTLQPFLDVAHDSWDMWNDWWVRNSFHPAAVTAPPIMALLILLIACFNFTNTSIAFSSRRLKEIGVRKVAGGHRKQIITQFMIENFLLTLLGLLLGLFLARFLDIHLFSNVGIYGYEIQSRGESGPGPIPRPPAVVYCIYGRGLPLLLYQQVQSSEHIPGQIKNRRQKCTDSHTVNIPDLDFGHGHYLRDHLLAKCGLPG